MKRGIGNYKGIRAITRDEALAMIPQVFAEHGRARAEVDRAWAEVGRARAEVDRAWAKVGRERAKVDRAWAEHGRARAEVDRAWAEVGRARAEVDRAWAEVGGYSPDWRAINFIAADRRNAVYCFVFCTTRNRNELWIYGGERCPNAKAIKKRGQVIWADETPKPPLP